MTPRAGSLDAQLAAIDSVLNGVAQHAETISRFRADLSAARFHLRRPNNLPIILAILGGTGTGKSTLLNRLLSTEIAAANFRRTFTAGPIAVVSQTSQLPPQWLGVEHVTIEPTQLPARGQPDRLSIAVSSNDLTKSVTLLDTPDLDGDQPLHHAQADRIFRWADAVLFLVTPEKYQMTELLPYYRLAKRYELPVLFAMNKVQEQAVVDDYQQQMQVDRVFTIPRDDAAYEPQADTNLSSLRETIKSLQPSDHTTGNNLRIVDLMDRLRDQIIDPLKNDRREVDRLIETLHAMETPPPGVDVNPLTQQLQRRLQQRSVLYLMGPGRVLDRVRQVPALLVRLPRTTWDLLSKGKLKNNGNDSLPADLSAQKPDFQSALVDQFAIVQSRIDDLLQSNPASRQWIERQNFGYADSKLDSASAGKIADDEISQLQNWLEKQWNATPRDTAVIQRLLKVVPGGQQLAKWSEAAPYLLAIVVATHHAFFGPVDLMILGGFSLATWLSEKLSNQVSSRTRAANNAITERFTELAEQQIARTCTWLQEQATSTRELQKLSEIADRISQALEPMQTQS